MKTFIALFLSLISLNLWAGDFQCRSYNRGTMIFTSARTQEVVIKDRFGNELEVVAYDRKEKITLMTEPTTEVTTFSQSETSFLKVYQQGDKISAAYDGDESFQCLVF